MAEPNGTKAKPTTPKPKKKKRRQAPGRTIEAREQQLVKAAIDLAAKQIANGTVTSQVQTHFLKLGSVSEKLAREKIINENILLKAKAEALESEKRVEELYREALHAMREYSGNSMQEEPEETFDD